MKAWDGADTPPNMLPLTDRETGRGRGRVFHRTGGSKGAPVTLQRVAVTDQPPSSPSAGPEVAPFAPSSRGACFGNTVFTMAAASTCSARKEWKKKLVCVFERVVTLSITHFCPRSWVPTIPFFYSMCCSLPTSLAHAHNPFYSHSTTVGHPCKRPFRIVEAVLHRPFRHPQPALALPEDDRPLASTIGISTTAFLPPPPPHSVLNPSYPYRRACPTGRTQICLHV
jgi:hypothetical protein